MLLSNHLASACKNNDSNIGNGIAREYQLLRYSDWPKSACLAAPSPMRTSERQPKTLSCQGEIETINHSSLSSLEDDEGEDEDRDYKWFSTIKSTICMRPQPYPNLGPGGKWESAVLYELGSAFDNANLLIQSVRESTNRQVHGRSRTTVQEKSLPLPIR